MVSPRLAACALGLAVPVLLLADTAAEAVQDALDAAQAERSSIEERLGIQVVAARLAADGYMIDFRFRIVDPKKAASLSDRGVRPYLIDHVSGAKLAVPSLGKVGRLRQVPHAAASGRTYFMFFANPGRLVKPGNRITIVIGDLKAEGLIVEG